MQYHLSKLDKIDILKPDDTVIIDFNQNEFNIEVLKAKTLIQQHILIWYGCETVELSNDRPGEKPTHYHTLYFSPQTPKHNLF